MVMMGELGKRKIESMDVMGQIVSGEEAVRVAKNAETTKFLSTISCMTLCCCCCPFSTLYTPIRKSKKRIQQ